MTRILSSEPLFLTALTLLLGGLIQLLPGGVL